MSGTSVLNADMATLGRWLRTGLAWWIEELSAMIPDRLKRPAAARGPLLAFDGDSLAAVRNGARVPLEPGAPALANATVLLPAGLCLQRSIETPAMSRTDLRRMLAFDGERYLPLPSGAALIASEIAGPSEAGRMRVDVAALPIGQARSLAATLGALALTPARIRIGDGEAADPRFDFVPAMIEAGLLQRPRAAALAWWMVVAFLFLLNLALLVWRDDVEVDRLAALVEAQQPGVSAAQRIVQRVQRSDALVRRAADRRQDRDAVAVLAAVSAAMPDGAWVQRYSWEGESLRLTGYKPRDVNVVAALRRDARFTGVRSAQTDAVAEVDAGQPFDVAARIGAR